MRIEVLNGTPLLAFLSVKALDKSAWGTGSPVRQLTCATRITAPCARGIFRADFGASSGADMYPASCAATYMPRARMVFEDRVQIKAAELWGSVAKFS